MCELLGQSCFPVAPSDRKQDSAGIDIHHATDDERRRRADAILLADSNDALERERTGVDLEIWSSVA